MKISIEFLKQESCNFDLECVFELNLNGKGITDLDSLSLCSNLEFLNLSSNEIKDLMPLKYLIKLQFLNLSCNQIRSLDGLDLLENLKTLNLAGNSISKIEEFFKLKNLKNLTQLKLSEVKSDFLTTGMPSIEYTNPICKNKNYTKEIFNIFTSLEVVDDHLRTRNNLMQNMMEILNKNESMVSKTSEFLAQIDSEPWLDDHLLTIDSNTKSIENSDSLDQQRLKFATLYDQLSESFKKTNELLEIIENNNNSN